MGGDSLEGLHVDIRACEEASDRLAACAGASAKTAVANRTVSYHSEDLDSQEGRYACFIDSQAMVDPG